MTASTRKVSDDNRYAPATPKQIEYATSLARRAGYRYLADAEKACWGRAKIGAIKRGEMSTLITWLATR